MFIMYLNRSALYRFLALFLSRMRIILSFNRHSGVRFLCSMHKPDLVIARLINLIIVAAHELSRCQTTMRLIQLHLYMGIANQIFAICFQHFKSLTAFYMFFSMMVSFPFKLICVKSAIPPACFSQHGQTVLR